jgi:hypothetical protein
MNFIQQSFLGLSNLLVMQPNNQRKKIPQSLLEEIAVISGKVNEAKKIIGDLKTWHDTGAEYHENIEKLSVDASDKFDKLEVAINEINETFKNSEQIIENISDREETTKDLSDAIEDTKILITEHSEKLKDIIKNSIDQQKIIKNNIDDSNKAGLAGSFKRRKDDLKTSIILWSIGLGISLILMFIISIKYILPEINNGYEKFLAKLPLIGPLIWSAWFCAKQFGLNNKIREDYAFKYASAMAYEGYKKETREVDEEMLKTLMEKSINNFSENPLRLITEKDGHNSPSNEIIDSFFKTIDKYGVEIIKKIRD